MIKFASRPCGFFHISFFGKKKCSYIERKKVINENEQKRAITEMNKEIKEDKEAAQLCYNTTIQYSMYQ